MAVRYERFMGGYTPMCNDCGIALCWDIDEHEYAENTAFWDAWKCQDCNGGVRFNKERWHAHEVEGG